jgi:uncharacterized membrane protein YccC
MVSRDDMRVSDAEREAAAARLREHFAAGRLTQEEFEDRLTAVFTATTRRDLGRVAADLPNHGSSPIMGIPVAQARTSPAGDWYPPRIRRRGRRRRSRLLLALAVMAAFWLLIAFSLPHGILLAALLVILTFVGLGTGLVLGLVWLGYRALRRAAWLAGGPGVPSLPGLARAVWATGHVRTAARSGTTR